ncbi:MAG: PSD1 and planctomycete cytochrome C domain-containing protein [Rhodopirellula sp. JB055]|uniref:PSD1 and planctomycete cytochrome C domain-containing protein n=1 Tax=Rhodopirellula sp. JB055 TaxID=3342846 RepID=UPI00370B008C
MIARDAMKTFAFSILALSLGLLAASETPAQDSSKITPEQLEFFENRIRPVLVRECYECHSAESGKTRGGLRLDTRDALLLGGESGPSIVPGHPEDSPFWDAITYNGWEMPPRGQLPDDVLADFKRWIEMGLPDPRVRESITVETEIDLESGRDHWAFHKPQPQGLPEVQRAAWAKSDVDRFVLAKLEDNGLEPAEDADAATLLRRLSFDLVGLPPTGAEVESFLRATARDREAAIESKVDELLNSPRFGERWGRHWLDVARYAESCGNSTNNTYPHAWRYRDYVIDSFNDDTPYDRFIAEQIAGDLLPVKTDEQWQENLIATGFLAIGTKNLVERNPRQVRADIIDEQIDTVSKAFLGLTVACARCHDHKLDPIPTIDYYAIAGIFQSTNTYYGTSEGITNRNASDLLKLPIADKVPAGRKYSPDEIEELQERMSDLRSEMMEVARDREDPSQQQNAIRLRAQIALIQGILSEIEDDGTPRTLAMGVQEAEQFEDAFVYVRGDVETPAQRVPRGFIQILPHSAEISIPSDSSGRLELAQWLTSPENPLTARVMVNRIWLHLFGEGIVATPNNWGLTGQVPSHPELLDHLAIEFSKDWSVKSMIRELVLSRTYQMSSRMNDTHYEVDPDNRLLWRASPRQLDAEAMRDAILAIGGGLNLERPIGSPIAKYGNNRIGRTLDASLLDGLNDRRSVYLPIVRDAVPRSLALFDFADPSLSNAKRDVSNVPTQALYLMNDEFVLQNAESLGRRLLDEHRSIREGVAAAFLATYGRPATDSEIRSCVDFFQEFMGPARRKSSRFVQTQQLAMTAFCQALIASAEFRCLN